MARRSTHEPAVHGGYMKSFAGAVDRLGADGRAIHEADPELFRAIEQATRLGWIPVDWNVHMVKALNRVLGPSRTHDFLGHYIYDQFETPLWRTFVDGAANGSKEPKLTDAAPRSDGGNVGQTGHSVCVRYAY